MTKLTNVTEKSPLLAAAIVTGTFGDTTVQGVDVDTLITVWYQREISLPASDEAGDYLGKTIVFPNGKAYLTIKKDLTISVRIKKQRQAA